LILSPREVDLWWDKKAAHPSRQDGRIEGQQTAALWRILLLPRYLSPTQEIS